MRSWSRQMEGDAPSSPGKPGLTQRRQGAKDRQWRKIATAAMATFAFALTSAVAVESATVIGEVTTDFPHYGLLAETFSWKEIGQMEPATAERVAKSVAASRMVVFAEQTPSVIFDRLFSTPSIGAALRGLLERGGLIYFNFTSGAILGGLPASMKDFFAKIDAFLVTDKNYAYVGNTPDDKDAGLPNPDLKHPFLTEPNAMATARCEISAIRHLAGALPETCKVLFITKEKRHPIMILQEGILGKGKIINSYVYTITRSAQNELIENIVHGLCGKLEKVSAKVVMAQKLGGSSEAAAAPRDDAALKVTFPRKTTTAPAIDGKLDPCWKDTPTLSLANYKDGTPPRKPTQVRVMYDEKNLYLFYTCTERNPAGLKTKCTTRDGQVWEDDCVEFLVSDGVTMPFHFIVSAAGIRYDAKSDKPQWNPDYEAAAGRCDEGWTVEMAIPLATICFNLNDKPLRQVNFCREEKQLPELTSWAPTPVAFGDPTRFGYLAFMPEKQYQEFAQNRSRPKKALCPSGFLVWYDNPYRRKFANTIPAKLEDVKSLRVLLAQGEKECSNVLITNFSDDPLTLRVERTLEGIKDDQNRLHPFERLITLKEAVPRLNVYKQRQMDPLVGLNEGNLLTVPAYETRQLWLDVRGNLPPGEYAASLTFVPVDNLWKEKKVDLAIKILPLVYPKDLPLMGYTFGPTIHPLAPASMREAYLAICPEYHITLAQILAPEKAINKDAEGRIVVSQNKDDYFTRIPVTRNGKTEYVPQEHLAKKYVKGWIYGYGVYTDFSARLLQLGLPRNEKRELEFEDPINLAYSKRFYEFDIPDEELGRIFREWISAWFKFLRKEKIKYSDFYLPLMDEPSNGLVPRVTWLSRIVKDVAPQAQLVSNPAHYTSLDSVRRLAPFLSLMIPHETTVYPPASSEKRERLSFYQTLAKPFTTYQCSMDVLTLPLLDYYRFRGLRCWQMKASGISLWCYNSYMGNDWNQFDVRFDGASSCMLFYHGDKGPIPSIRVESFREAFEDYYLLHLAAQQLEKGTNEKLRELTSAASLERLMSEEDPDRMLEWRELMLNELCAGGENRE